MEDHVAPPSSKLDLLARLTWIVGLIAFVGWWQARIPSLALIPLGTLAASIVLLLGSLFVPAPAGRARSRLTMCAVAAAVIGVVWWLNGLPRYEGPEPGRDAPVFASRLIDGTRIDHASFKGARTLLVFYRGGW